MEDADRLRRAAAVLNQRAADLLGVSQRLAGQTAGMVYAGPAANEFRAAMTEKQHQLGRCAGDLRVAADTMVRSAMEIEAGAGRWGAP